MKVLYKIIIIIISFSIIFSSCKKQNSVKEKKVVFEKKMTNNNIKTIDDFLKKMKIAIKSNNRKLIEKSIKFPLNYSMTGENEFIENYEELKKSLPNILDNMLKTKAYKKVNDSIYSVNYSYTSTNNDIESYYGITFYFLKNKKTFLLYKIEEVEAI